MSPRTIKPANGWSASLHEIAWLATIVALAALHAVDQTTIAGLVVAYGAARGAGLLYRGSKRNGHHYEDETLP